MKNIIRQISAQAMRGFLTLGLIFCVCCALAQAQTTIFTYQGRLTVSSASASGTFDLEFKLFNAAGTQIGAAQVKEEVIVTNGIFTVQLDADLFEANAFDGGERLLEIGVRRGTETGEFTTLTPRQPVTSTPYAVRSLNAATADLATNAAQLGGTEANEFVQTDDTRLSDNRMPTSGSGFYIQNQNSVAQTSANFNISETGEANVFNARTQYNIGGQRVLFFNDDNLFAGLAGAGNTTGNSNSFVGSRAGNNNTSGSRNSFFGNNAGFNNTTGSDNSFFGLNAALINTTGSFNTLIGNSTSVSSGNLNFAAAFGSFARVTTNDTIVIGKVAGTYNSVTRPADAVQIPGTLTVAGVINGTVTNATQLGGIAASGFIQNTTTQQISSNFNISGDGKANVFDAASGYNMGGFRVFTATSVGGTLSTLVGASAGQTSSNTGTENVFVGTQAGNLNAAGSFNSFVGRAAGSSNNSGGYNSFFGNSAGLFNTTGSNNSFFGINAGYTNATGGNNTALGGFANFGANNLNFAAAIGSNAVVNASDTIVLGKVAGTYNGVPRPADAVQIPGSLTVTGAFSANLTNLNASNITSGTLADTRLSSNVATLSGAQTFTGAKTFSGGISGGGAGLTNLNASNIASGTLDNARLGIVAIANGGTGSATQNFVDLTTAQTIAGDKTFTGALSGNSVNSQTQFTISGNRRLRIDSLNNILVGTLPNDFFGGEPIIEGSNNSFFGINVGAVGNDGNGVTTLGSNNTLVGAQTNLILPNLNYATVIGSGARATTSNTIVLGRPDGSDSVSVSGRINAYGGLTASSDITASGGIALTGSSLRLLESNDNNNRIYYNTGINGIVFSAGDGFRWFNVRNNRTNMFLTTSGDLGIVGSYGQISDARYKTNVQTFADALDAVRRLRGVTFNWKPELNKSSDTQIGFIAQEVEAVLPQLVLTDKEGYKTVAYSNAVPVLVEAIKEQQTQIERQQKQIDELKQIVCAIKPDANVCKSEEK